MTINPWKSNTKERRKKYARKITRRWPTCFAGLNVFLLVHLLLQTFRCNAWGMCGCSSAFWNEFWGDVQPREERITAYIWVHECGCRCLCVCVCVERNGSHWKPTFCASCFNRYGTVMTYDIYFILDTIIASRVPAGVDNLRFILQDELFSFRRIKLKRCKGTDTIEWYFSRLFLFSRFISENRTFSFLFFAFGTMNCVFQSQVRAHMCTLLYEYMLWWWCRSLKVYSYTYYNKNSSWSRIYIRVRGRVKFNPPFVLVIVNSMLNFIEKYYVEKRPFPYLKKK